jgi:hypothetical protein
MILRFPPGAQSTVKNENHFSIAKSTSFYSEFDADSEYVILFKKCFGQKNGLTATCPLVKNILSNPKFQALNESECFTPKKM